MQAITDFIASRDFYNNNKAANEFAQKMALSIYDMYITGGCSEAEALGMAIRVVAVHEKDATYECYCQECDATLDMTEEEFEDDDELKLCDSCQANVN